MAPRFHSQSRDSMQHATKRTNQTRTYPRIDRHKAFCLGQRAPPHEGFVGFWTTGPAVKVQYKRRVGGRTGGHIHKVASLTVTKRKRVVQTIEFHIQTVAIVGMHPCRVDRRAGTIASDPRHGRGAKYHVGLDSIKKDSADKSKEERAGRCLHDHFDIHLRWECRKELLYRSPGASEIRVIHL